MDLIDRQEAIDRIEAIFPVDPHANECAEGVAIGAALAKQYIETLPSAQPEIVRCKYCKHNQLPETSANASCEIFYGMTDQHGFCHKSERRTDDQT